MRELGIDDPARENESDEDFDNEGENDGSQ